MEWRGEVKLVDRREPKSWIIEEDSKLPRLLFQPARP